VVTTQFQNEIPNFSNDCEIFIDRLKCHKYIKIFSVGFFSNTFPLTVIYTITPCLKKRATFGLLTYNFDTHEWILIFGWQ